MRGGLLVPALDAFAWRQGAWEEGRAEKKRSAALQRAKLAHLIAHPTFRSGVAGRTFKVPQYVVTMEAGDVPAGRLLEDVERVLSGPTHDLVVRLELPDGHAGRARLERQLGPDPRVRVAPARSALEAFPASPFQVALPAGKPLHEDAVGVLRAELGDAVVGSSALSDGSYVSIVRTWALHRALRTPWEAVDFGEVVTIPSHKLLVVTAAATSAKPTPALAGRSATGALHRARARLLAELRRVVRPVVARRGSAAGVAPPPRAEYPLGVEIAALGERSRGLFAASRRVAWTTAGQHLDLVVADTAAEAVGVAAPAVVLSEAPPLLSVPAFDPRRHNPIGWRHEVGDEVGALGPLDRLPPGRHADFVLGRDDLTALREIHHLEDVQAFHADTVTRAGELARLAATGVLVHLADGDRRLAPYVGAELFDLMTREARGLDMDGREALSIRMRRAALREHSLTSRVRQLAELVLADPPQLPLVSILLVTRRPELLESALAAVRRQTYPRLELVLGLHGEGFVGVDSRLADLPMPATVVRIDSKLPLGAALNLTAAAAAGTLLTKMDDDDAYGREHLWDLVLAHEYSQAQLVGKLPQFVYLAASNVTVQFYRGISERYSSESIGGTMLVQRDFFNRIAGFPCVPHSVDLDLFDKIREHKGQIYVTHGTGFVLVRHGEGHTWNSVTDEWFIDRSYFAWPGWDPDQVPIQDMAASYLPPTSSRAPLLG